MSIAAHRATTPAAGTFVEQDDFGVQVVGQRYREKKENKPAKKCRPLLQGCALRARLLVRPMYAPYVQRAKRDHQPEDIEK